MHKSIAPKGSSESFIRDNVHFGGDECLLWPYRVNDRGYGLAVIGGKQRAASRWMCVMAHGPSPADRPHAAHRCGNAACVNPRHLYWATPRENSADKTLHGTDNRGERNGKTKLTEADVRAIRAAPPKLAPLMEKYGLTKHGVSKIRSGKRWGHVK